MSVHDDDVQQAIVLLLEILADQLDRDETVEAGGTVEVLCLLGVEV